MPPQAGTDAVYIIVRNGLKHFLLDKKLRCRRNNACLRSSPSPCRSARRRRRSLSGVTFRRDRARPPSRRRSRCAALPPSSVHVAGIVTVHSPKSCSCGLPGSSGCTVPPVSSSGGVSSSQVGKAHDAKRTNNSKREQYDPKLFHPSFLPHIFAGTFSAKTKKSVPSVEDTPLHCSISDRWHKTFRTRGNKRYEMPIRIPCDFLNPVLCPYPV